jgi:hypothetical protein
MRGGRADRPRRPNRGTCGHGEALRSIRPHSRYATSSSGMIEMSVDFLHQRIPDAVFSLKSKSLGDGISATDWVSHQDGGWCNPGPSPRRPAQAVRTPCTGPTSMVLGLLGALATPGIVEAKSDRQVTRSIHMIQCVPGRCRSCGARGKPGGLRGAAGPGRPPARQDPGPRAVGHARRDWARIVVRLEEANRGAHRSALRRAGKGLR